MAETVRTPEAVLVTGTVMVDGAAIPDTMFLREVEVVHEVNRVPYARLTIVDGSAADETFAHSERGPFEPGKTVDVRVGYNDDNASIFKGLILRHSASIGADGDSALVLTCYDAAVRTTIGRSSSQFLKAKDSDAIAALLRAAGLTARVEDTGRAREHVIKNGATDWDFILALAEANGMIVLVEDGTVSVRRPRFEAPRFVVRHGDAVAALDIEIDALDQLAAVTCRAWDPAAQAVVSATSQEPSADTLGNLDGRTLAKALAVKDYGNATYAPLGDAALKDWADAQLLKSRLSRVRGTLTFPGHAGILPGEQIALDGLGARFNGPGWVSAVRHRVAVGVWTTEVTLGLPRKGFTEANRDADAPAAAGRLPGAGGLQIAKVKQVHDDPEGQHRIKVTLPLVRDGAEGVWVRVAAPFAGVEAGVTFLPEVGDEVVLGFVDGDPGAAVVLGALHSGGRARPLVPDETNTRKAIVTTSKLSLAFDEKAKSITLSTPGGHTVTLSDDGKAISLVDSTGNEVHLAEAGVTLTSPGDVTIHADGKLTLEGKGGVAVASSAGDVAVKGGNIAAEARMGMTAKGGSSAEMSSSGTTTVKGTMVMIN